VQGTKVKWEGNGKKGLIVGKGAKSLKEGRRKGARSSKERRRKGEKWLRVQRREGEKKGNC
jgi:hypothetical protein